MKTRAGNFSARLADDVIGASDITVMADAANLPMPLLRVAILVMKILIEQKHAAAHAAVAIRSEALFARANRVRENAARSRMTGEEFFRPKLEFLCIGEWSKREKKYQRERDAMNPRSVRGRRTVTGELSLM